MNKSVIPVVFIVLVVLAISFSSQMVMFYTDFLWFENLGFASMFIKVLQSKLLLGLLFGVVFFLWVTLNMFLAYRLSRKPVSAPGEGFIDEINTKIPEGYKQFSGILVFGIALMSIIIALGAATNWDIFLRYINYHDFNVVDPVFNKDVGFFVFKLPVFKYVCNWLLFVIVLTSIMNTLIYLFKKNIYVGIKGIRLGGSALIHLAVIGFMFFLVKTCAYRVNAYELLFSKEGIVFGAAYSDLFARLPVLRIMSVVSVICAVMCIVAMFTRDWRPLAGGLILLIGVSFLGNSMYPVMVQKFKVVPNEIAVESPYIKRNIEYTRKAYNLDNIEVKEFTPKKTLNKKIIERNRSTIDNIRLWDHRPLLTTYQQLQGIRTYYKFVDVDLDRYYINGKYTQVAISAREIDYDSLPSKIWINEHLSFTHGYGVCLSPVNSVTAEGMPDFFVKDIPPAYHDDLAVEYPSIYYGELNNEYVIVNTKSKEFDYPAGEKNIYSIYNGAGGVRISSIIRRLAFALRFSSMKIILNTDITGKSRIMYYRRVKDRLKRICPFLEFEYDPYIVISEGRLYWICDGYTFTDRYPYAQPVNKKINYIRNSVKAVVDAYNGDVQLYISDKQDPIIKAYSGIFPGIFKQLEDMPEGLKAHLRYPEQLFKIQSSIYSVYHMDDPQIFYNKEDVWNLPNEIFERTEEVMDPYYIIMKLPGETKEEFIIMQPFTPMKKNNLAAWFCAKCDSEDYGKLVVYLFPKKELIYGPMQIEARIDQDPEISQQLSLWGQVGSDVIRGNLLVIPIEESLVYIEPLYLKADRGQLPQLKRVIVAFDNRIAMEKDLYSALSRVMGGHTSTQVEGLIETLSGMANKALQHYNKAKESHKDDNWAEFGEQWNKLGEMLEKLKSGAVGK